MPRSSTKETSHRLPPPWPWKLRFRYQYSTPRERSLAETRPTTVRTCRAPSGRLANSGCHSCPENRSCVLWGSAAPYLVVQFAVRLYSRYPSLYPGWKTYQRSVTHLCPHLNHNPEPNQLCRSGTRVSSPVWKIFRSATALTDSIKPKTIHLTYGHILHHEPAHLIAVGQTKSIHLFPRSSINGLNPPFAPEPGPKCPCRGTIHQGRHLVPGNFVATSHHAGRSNRAVVSPGSLRHAEFSVAVLSRQGCPARYSAACSRYFQLIQ